MHEIIHFVPFFAAMLIAGALILQWSSQWQPFKRKRSINDRHVMEQYRRFFGMRS